MVAICPFFFFNLPADRLDTQKEKFTSWQSIENFKTP